MPRMPKWLADSSKRLLKKFMHPVQVTKVHNLNKQLRKVRFEGDLSNTKFEPGNVIEFRINGTEFRHYTPLLFEKGEGICEVLFYLHNLGPGSKWAGSLKVGDNLKLLGPGGKITVQNSEHHVLIGDETSLGFCILMINAIKEKKQQYQCLLELQNENQNWPELLNLEATTTAYNSLTCNILPILKQIQFDLLNTTFYLTGNLKSIREIRKFLKQRGASPKQMLSEPYWAEGKQGL